MAASEIQIISLLPPTLSTREGATRLAHEITKEVNNSGTIILNFQGVMFMSRSFADQLHKDLSIIEFKLNLVFKNADEGILEMLEAVRKTQTQRKSINKSYRVLRFENLLDLQDYCSAW